MNKELKLQLRMRFVEMEEEIEAKTQLLLDMELVAAEAHEYLRAANRTIRELHEGLEAFKVKYEILNDKNQ